MRKTVGMALALGVSLFGGCAGTRTAKARYDGTRPLKVLMIGNSFSICNMTDMPSIARAMGLKLDLASLYIGGCTLKRHWANFNAPKTAPYALSWNYCGDISDGVVQMKSICREMTRIDKKTGKKHLYSRRCNIPDALVADKWDVITVQQGSHESWLPEKYRPYGDELVAAIRRLAPQAEVIVQETWAYTPFDGRLATWKLTQGEMFSRLHDAYVDFAARNDMRVIPMGSAVEHWRKDLPVEYREDSLGGDVVGNVKFERRKDGTVKTKGDAFHLNRRGEYLQGLVWTATLYGVDVTKCQYRPSVIDEALAVRLRKVAMDATAR